MFESLKLECLELNIQSVGCVICEEGCLNSCGVYNRFGKEGCIVTCPVIHIDASPEMIIWCLMNALNVQTTGGETDVPALPRNGLL